MQISEEILVEKPRLWGTGTTRTLRPIWVAEEIGLDYDLVSMGPRTGETKTADYTKLNPKQKIPYLTDCQLQLSESIAISQYLIDQYDSEQKLYAAKTVVEKAKYQEWCCYLLAELDETSLYVIRRHQDLKEIYGEAPEAVAAAFEYFRKYLNVTATVMTDPFIVGGRFSLADVILTSCLIWAQKYGIDIPASLKAYFENIVRREAFQRAIKINKTQFEGVK
ncbi:MAG: glutathione S-transferase family protein [Sneathiellales bacterium]|nr:glutathione S-transferase family protein [Sneathiellales bacterium]